MKFNNKVIVFTTATALIMFVALSLGFNSNFRSGNDYNTAVNKDTSKSEKKYYFSTREEGERIHWKVIVRDGEIESLYKNGDRLSDDEIGKYEDMIYEKIGNMHFDFDSFATDIPDIDIHFDSGKFNKQMEDLKEKMKGMNFDFKFDNKKFKKQMEKMREKFKDMHDCDYFDGEALERAMDEINRNLENLPKNIHVNIDGDALAERMENINITLKDLKIDMSGLREKMRQLKGFMKEIRSELIKDGYLDEDDENFDMEFTKDKLEINGKRLPDNLLEKYKEMYKEHFGKEISDKFRIMN